MPHLSITAYYLQVDTKKILGLHCVKSARIWSFSGPYFPVFSPNAGKYGPEKLRIGTLFTQC